jgi:hypothetical protein
LNTYEKNLNILRENSSELYNLMLAGKSKNDLKLRQVEDQLNYIMETDVCSCFMHSIYDNNREINQMFSSVPKDAEVIVIFGLGLGYCIDYIENNFKRVKKIFIVEPSVDIFKKFLENVDLYKFIEKFEDVTFIVNKTEIEASAILIPMLGNYIKYNLDFVYSISYRTAFENYYESLHNNVIEYFRSYRVNNATAELFQDKWLVNVIRNIKHNEAPIESLFNKFKGNTAILVSAGPSLNGNIDLLKKINDDVLIVAVGSAIKILHNNGISPHLRFAIDGSYGQQNIFDEVDTSCCPLVHSNLSFYDIPRNYSDDKIRMVLDTDFLTMYILKKADIKFELIASGNSVANVALNTLCKMGFNRIAFVGQDLCYTRGELYAKGSWKQETITEERLKNGDLVKVKNINDEEVYTNLAFLGMKKGLEACISGFPKIEFINSTEGGLAIKGAGIKSLQKVIESDIDNISSLNTKLRKILKENKIKDYEVKINKAILQLNEELQQLIEFNEKRLSILSSNSLDLKAEALQKIVDEIHDYDIKMKNIGLFEEAIKKLLEIKFSAIHHGFLYRGNDENLKNKSILRITLNEAIVLREYLDFLKFLIEEFKGERVLNLVYEE